MEAQGDTPKSTPVLIKNTFTHVDYFHPMNQHICKKLSCVTVSGIYLKRTTTYSNAEESLPNLPDTYNSLLSYVWLRDSQGHDPEFLSRCNEPESEYHKTTFNDKELVCYTKTELGKETYWKFRRTD